MRALLATAFLLALLLPLLLVGSSAWAWWPGLSYPWAFVASGLCLLYAVAASLMTRQFRDIGIAGQASAEVGRGVAAIMRRESIYSLAVFFVVAVPSLWLLRSLLSR